MTTTETTTHTSESKITRRKMLQVLPLTSAALASSADAIAPVPAALRASTTSPETIDPVFAAIAVLEAAEKKSSAAYEALNDAEEAARAKHGNRPFQLIAWRNYSAIGGGEIDDRRELFLRLPGADPAQIERE